MHASTPWELRYARRMRGGVQVWKRGINGHGLRHATAYALQGGCDAAEVARQVSAGADAAVDYGAEDAPTVARWTVTEAGAASDRLDHEALRAWIDGTDPATGEQRGRANVAADSHLLYDSTINAPKTYSLAAVLHPELREEFDGLMDRITAETVTAWRDELSTRRGQGGKQRIGISQIEVVQLDHERSRSLDPHAHRHLWLSAKVLGEDGKWANVDSQQVFRHQVLVNARGELAARTDARWRQALAAHGYTLNADGEISELAHVVQPMSKRAQQITRNKARFEAEWRAAHPGSEPTPRIIEMWDRRAWALDRAQKPDNLDEDQWRDQVRREIAEIDPATLAPRSPVQVGPSSLVALDRDRLTQTALGWADQRSIRSQGRLSVVDLRAGATMAVAQAQLIADPAAQAQLIDELTTRALMQVQSLAPAGSRPPDDVKVFRLDEVGQQRRRITERAAIRAALGDPAPADPELLGQAVAVVDTERAAEGEGPIRLDSRQVEAAAAVAGASPLVVIEGPAGAGKTTMLTVAERALALQDRRMVTVAPTMKAAQVASQEIGTDGSSLHALLFQHGYRWRTEESGRTFWHRLSPGDVDTDGSVYHGPSEAARLSARDVIVCDEAGMVDLDAMAALLTVADEAHAAVTLVGDPRQVRPVGHSGAMALVQGQTPDAARIDLEAVHRFRRADDPRETDHEYARVSRELRDATSEDTARELALWLTDHGHVTRAEDTTAQVELLTQEWLTAHGAGQSIALMADDNATVDEINQAVQAARLNAGQLDADTAGIIRDRQVVRVGDHVTTRRNHRGDEFSVTNREQWTVAGINDDGALVVTGGLDQRTETIPVEYAAEHVTLGYASTVHGAQGVTADRAMTIVSETTTAAQLYVGMTRGRFSNTAVTAASSDRASRASISDAMIRGRSDLNDDQLRALVAADVERAGDVADGRQAPEGHVSWRDEARPFGDLVDPEPVYDRLTRQRASLTERARHEEARRETLAQRLAHDLDPAVAVAQRDGLTGPELDRRVRQRDVVKEQLTQVTDEVQGLTRRLNRAETQVQQLSDEIRYRLTMDPETARLEQHDRENAAIYEPARPTDELRRPFGLAPNLTAEQSRLDQERAKHQQSRDRAIAQETAIAARAADARDDATDARERLATTHREYDAAHGQLTAETFDRITADLDALHAAEDRAASAGVLTRRGARRAVDEARARLAAQWGLREDETPDEAWARDRAEGHADDAMADRPIAHDLEDARARTADADARHEAAVSAEARVHDVIASAAADLADDDSKARALAQERELRRQMPDELASKERRLRGARQQSAGRFPQKVAAGAQPTQPEPSRRRGPAL